MPGRRFRRNRGFSRGSGCKKRGSRAARLPRAIPSVPFRQIAEVAQKCKNKRRSCHGRDSRGTERRQRVGYLSGLRRRHFRQAGIENRQIDMTLCRGAVHLCRSRPARPLCCRKARAWSSRHILVIIHRSKISGGVRFSRGNVAEASEPSQPAIGSAFEGHGKQRGARDGDRDRSNGRTARGRCRRAHRGREIGLAASAAAHRAGAVHRHPCGESVRWLSRSMQCP